MPATLTTDDLNMIRAVVRAELDISAPPVRIPAILGKLTVAEFAHCVQRSAYSIRERRRTNRKFRAHCEGECPIKIHPAALALYGVDSGLASARLQQFRAPSKEQSVDTATPPLA
jgi:hypothetical protein